MQRTIILGSGGHAKVIIELLREGNLFEPIGCLAPEATSPPSVLGVPRLGDDDLLPNLKHEGIRHVFVALGDNRLRERLCRRAIEMGFQLASAISRHAFISPTARIGQGVAIMPGAHLGPDSTVGDGVIVNTHAAVDHDGVLGTCCHIGPGATLAGCVTVGARAFVATNATVLPERTIGDRTIVGAGSVVVRDLPADVVAYGNPARRQRDLPLETGVSSSRGNKHPALRLVG